MAEVAKRWSRGKLESVPACPACGSHERSVMTYQRRDDGHLMPDVWTMVKCIACDSLYLDPRPDSDSLPRAYADYYTHHPASEEFPERGARGLVWRLIRGYLNKRFGMRRLPSNTLGYILFLLIEPLRLKLDYFGRHLTKGRFPEPGRLLDAGCGNGAFLLRAREMGWDVVGCEPDPVAVATCHTLELDVVEGDILDPALSSQRFDVITLSHVLEHVAEPARMLRRAFDLLRPGGAIWIALPNPRSFGVSMFGTNWNGLHVPFHLVIPSQARLRQIVSGAGFVELDCLRRGHQSRTNWSQSMAIARMNNASLPPGVVIRALNFFSDLLASVSCRYAEETVLMARKPITGDE